MVTNGTMVDAVRDGYRQAVLICLTGLTPFLALAQEAGSSSDSAVFDALAMQEEQAVAQATEELIADGKRLVSERSFAQAANAFEEALALLPADVALRFELRWRYFDSAARAVTARTDGRERTLQQLEQELRTLSDKLFASRDGRPPELWAKVQQSIGLVCAKLNRVEAMEVAFERALDWWAGAPASEAARNAYLGTVDEILRLMDTGGSRSEGTLPRFAHWLEGAIELAEAPVQKAQYLIRLAELRVRRGGLEAAQARESFERALKTAEDTDFWREAAFAFVAYLRAYGKPAWTDDGDLRFEPDDTEAVGLLHRLAADPGAYRAPEAQRLLETITRTTVSLGGGRAFRPGQSVSVAAYFRNPEDLPIRAGRLDLAGITCTTEGFRAPFQTTVFESTLRSDAYAPYVPHRETFELGRLQAGLYQARTLGPAGEVFSEVIAVTRAALLVRTDREGLHFWLGQAATGKPLAGTVDVFGAERRSRRNGTEDPMPWERQRIQLAEDGTGFLPWSALGGATVDLWRVLARSEAGPAVAHGYRTYQPGDENAVRCYAFTDRPVYRPGQKVHWRMFLRQLTGGDWSVPDPASPPIQYTIESARGTTLAAGELTLNAYGAAGGTLELSEDVELGEASLRLERKVKRSPNPFAPLFAESLSARIFRIEGYRRPDFEVKIATAEPKAGFRPGDDLSITVSADYADSGPVIDAPIELEVIRKALPHRAGGDLTPTQSDHAQDEPERFQARTDVEGEAHFELEVPYTTGADFQFTLRATVEGPDGAQVQTRQEIVVTEQAYFVEVDTDRTLIQPGEAVTANVSARHGNGSPASVDGELTLERLRYRELWVGPEGERVSGATLRERTRQEAVFGQPLDWTQWRLEAREESREPVATLQVATDADGRAGERITLTEPGRYTLSWQSHDSERRPIKASVGLTVAGPGSNLLPDGRFRMETPKTVYAIGQRVPVLLTCPVPTAHALLTVETDRATESLIVPLSEGSGWAELVVSEAWTPSVTLRAEFIGGFGLRTATTTLEVPPKQFELNVTVTPASPTATPGSELPIALEVTRGDGSPAEGEITLSVYDAALEPIRAPMPKDPFAHFYGQREAVGRVSYLSSLRQMPFVAETPGRLVSVTEEASNGLFSVEGASFRARAKRADAPSSTHASEIIVRHDLRETAAWIPGMALDAEGRATAIIDLPDDTTRWVARAWAGGLPARFGTGEATFTTRLPLTAGLKLPQFLVAGDKTLTRGTVLNQTGEAATVVTVASVDGALSLQTKQAATLTLQPGETGVVELPLETALPGTGRVAFRARAEPLGDGLRRTVPVVPAGLPLTETLGGRLQAPLNEMLWEVPHYDPNGATASLSLAPTPAVALVDALPYLAAQPDTLTEQVVSRFVPLVVGHAMLLRLGLNEAEANAVIHATLPQEAAADNRPALAGRIRASLAALAEHQNPDGGWGWWCGADTSDPYMTAYAVWGLTLAQRAGVTVSPATLTPAREFLLARVESVNDADLKTWMLFALAARFADQAEPTPEAVEGRVTAALWRSREQLSDFARALLTVATHRQGFPEEARILLEDLVAGARRPALAQSSYPAANDGTGTELPETAYWGQTEAWAHWSQGAVEATSFALLALNTVGEETALARAAAQWLVTNRQGARWANSRASAVAVCALAEYLGAGESPAFPWSASARLNGMPLGNVAITDWADAFRAPALEIPAGALNAGENRLVIERSTGSAPVFVSALVSYYSQEAALTASGRPVTIDRRFALLEPRPTLLQGAPPVAKLLDDGEAIAAGALVETTTTFVLNQACDYLIIEERKPAGFEPLVRHSGLRVPVRRVVDGQVAAGGPVAHAYAEWQDKGVKLYLDSLPAGTWQVTTRWRAEHPGNYSAPPTRLYAPYVEPFAGHSPEARLEISTVQPKP